MLRTVKKELYTMMIGFIKTWKKQVFTTKCFRRKYKILCLYLCLLVLKLHQDNVWRNGKNVPIKEIAKAIGKDAQYVRVGIQQGILKFGVAIKMEDSNEYNYYCPDKKVWEETGYFNEATGTE